MATVAGSIKSISNGIFNVKDENGNVRALNVGDEIHENDTVYGENGNSSSSQIEIQLSGDDIIVLNAGQKQLIDSSLIETAFGTEELFFTKEGLDLKADEHNADANVVSDLRDAEFNADNKDITEEVTAEGKEEVADETTATGEFQARDGNATDIISDLRNAQFKSRTQVFEDKSAFESESKDRLSSLENTDRPSYTNITVTPSTPPPSTPPVTIIKIVAADEFGNPLKDGSGNYLSVNETPEGGHIYYVALAFKSGSTVFNDASKLATQEGTVDFTFKNGTATTSDYTPQTGLTTITLGTAVSADALDDYIADNGEKFTVTISNYVPTSSSNYGAVTINGSGVTTTITDNSTTTPNENSTTETTQETVILKIVACDSNGEPIITAGKYTFVNSVTEGNEAKYMILAFKPGTTDFTPADKVDVQGGTVTIKTADNTAIGVASATKNDGTQDYILETAKTVTVGTAFEIKTINDYISDNNETYKVSINDKSYTHPTTPLYENVTTNLDPVTTKIIDTVTPSEAKIILVATDSSGTISLTVDGKVDLTKNTNITPEGGKLYYKAVAIDADGKLLDTQAGKVTVTYATTTDTSDKDATANTDYVNTYIEATIGTMFSVDAKDDYYAEGNENFTVKISAPTATPYENVVIDTSHDMVTSTIQDNPAKVEQPDTGTGNDNPNEPGNYGKDDTVYVKITKTPSTVEGGNLVHTITLVDKDGNPVTVPVGQTVTVNLTYTSTGNVVTDDDFSTIVKQITIIGGTNHTDFTNITKDDFVSEGDEVYTVTISGVSQSGAFENVAIATDALAIPSASNHTTGTIKDGIILGNPVNAKVYEDGLNTSATTENDLGKSLGITNPNADTYTVSFDKTITTTTETSNGKAISYSYNTDGTILTATRAGDNKIVFTVELKKDGSGNDVYDFKLKTVMDHAYGNNSKNQFYMPFEFNITSNGTTSTNQTFNVTVVDSVPSAIPIIVTTKEDTAITIRLADDDFKVGETVTINGVAHSIGATGIAIYEQGDTTKQIGSLTINSNGTVTFTPSVDYSNYDTTKSPQFSYTVKDFDGDEATSTVTINVKPVADTITITPSTPTMTEDDGNTKEGTHQVALGLTKPSLSKDQTDRNFSTGDHPEKNGEITLTFTNGDKVIGAKIFKADGITQVGADITTANQTLKIVIVTTSGDSSTIDYTYHHADITASNPSGAIYLTVGEYEALKIQHAEDNDTDIKINISATSYELNDSDKPLSITDADLYETTTNPMTVKINPATDNISLNWDTATGGSITQVDKTGASGNNNVANTFTFTTKAEGAYFSTPIDLKAILTNANGTQNDGTPKGGDLDGSEKRTYTVSGIPDGTIITLGGQSATANALGVATIIFNDTNNKNTDPEFSMKLPEQYSGTVTGKITLSVQDKGVDSGDTAGATKTAEVYFNVVVTPVADIATIQVSQAVGYEDAGRDGGNTIAKDGTINANGTGGIPLAIKVSSDDKDGSEIFDVTISAIPTDAVIYYNGVLQAQTGNSISITNFDNTKSLVIIPPHNSDTDFTLNVSAVTKDGASTSGAANTTIDVIVKNVADAPVGTDLNTNINVNEDNQLNLKSIYTHPENLASYDDSEVLTVKIELPTGFTIASGSLFYIENGMYVVKASDISAGNIKLNVPTNFSGSADLKLTYVTTEKAGEGDSKTWDTQTVNIFVNPIADDVTVAASSTINEDADGSANKIDLKPSLTDTDGSETITSVKILASSVATGYELFLGSANGTSIASKLVGLYYELTPEEANSIYAKNTIPHDADNIDSFNLTVVYTVKDTAGSTNVTKDFTHTHTVNVQAVTDAPTLTLGTITQKSGSVTISGSTVTVVNENSEFKVPVTTTSNDKDGSETVTKIVISGVPMGVEVVGGTYYGYSGSQHNGIWEISTPTDSKLDANGALSEIVFKVNTGADFEKREIIITTYTQDGVGAEVKNASQTIHINAFDAPSPGPGNPPLFDLSTKTAIIYEDNNDGTQAVIYNLGKSIDVTNSGGSASGNYAITITDFPTGTTVSGASYSYENGGKTYYVVVGTGNAADVATKLSTVIVTPPTDMNTGGAKDGQMTFSATISTFDGGTFKSGTGIPSYTETIIPVTDKMTVAVTADNINEDATSNLSITLSNPNDGSKTELLSNSITIKVTETWADVTTGGGTKGTLSGTGYNITESPAGTYTITKTDGTPFPIGTAITGLQYTPASNRDGSVDFEVSVQNKETGSSVTLVSTGNTSINVTPVIDVVLNASVVTATGIEDTAVTVGTTTLANPVKLEITAGTFADGSEKIGNIILDEVPNGFTVWYKVGTDLVMATNIGTTGGGTFDINPNITTDAAVTKNKWLVPSSADGSIPEVYINAPTNWSGDFDFKAKFSVSEQNLSTITPITVDVTGHINSVADTMNIAPTLTFGDAFSWVDLKLNANMKDVDGSETMSLKITGLDDMAQFQLANGTAVNSSYNTATNTWELKDIIYDQINNIQFAHDKSVASVGVTANTVEIGNTTEGATASATFELKVSDVSGNFKLDSGLSLDFSKIDTINTLKNIDKIDLTETGSNKLLNLSLQDVLDMSGSSKEIKITGIAEDEVSFKTADGWNAKTAGTGSDAGFDIYTNSGDSSVKVKVEQPINDHII